VEKVLPLFKKLDGITATELVYFYDEFQKIASVCHSCLLMPSVLSWVLKAYVPQG
jgi:hypothetical protein